MFASDGWSNNANPLSQWTGGRDSKPAPSDVMARHPDKSKLSTNVRWNCAPRNQSPSHHQPQRGAWNTPSRQNTCKPPIASTQASNNIHNANANASPPRNATAHVMELTADTHVIRHARVQAKRWRNLTNCVKQPQIGNHAAHVARQTNTNINNTNDNNNFNTDNNKTTSRRIG